MARKSFTEELKLFHRYSELTEPYFVVLRKNLNSENPQDQKWAVEQLSKAYVKMIPQDMDVTSKGESISGLSEAEKTQLLSLLNEPQSS